MEQAVIERAEEARRADPLTHKRFFASRVRRWEIATVVFCAMITLYSTIYPIFRACLLVEVSYNEGWNAYNAETLAHHLPLYAARYGWTTVNYPVLSFWVISKLSRFTHDFLFTGRAISIISLLVSGLLVGVLIRKLKGSIVSSILGGFFIIAIFCANADVYVGANDPQLFAQTFFIAGLLVYVSRREHLGGLVLVALLFVLGGCIKHNMIDIPVAVLVDLALVSRKRLLQFCAIGAALLGTAIMANIWIGGPYFTAQLLTPRLYSVAEIGSLWAEYYPVILVPFLAALGMAIRTFKVPNLRIISLHFWTSFVVGMGFSGGAGVAINTYFSNTVAITILLSIMFDQVRTGTRLWPRCRQALVQTAVPCAFFAWLFIPMVCNGIISAPDNFDRLISAQKRFVGEVKFLRAQPGPTICESLLRCYVAGKPYIYDPFNSTSLILAGKLNSNMLVDRIQNRQFGAIQFSNPPRPGKKLSLSKDRFADPILDAIDDNYTLELKEKDCAVFLPREPDDICRKHKCRI